MLNDLNIFGIFHNQPQHMIHILKIRLKQSKTLQVYQMNPLNFIKMYRLKSISLLCDDLKTLSIDLYPFKKHILCRISCIKYRFLSKIYE